jgi:hypothetical protein
MRRWLRTFFHHLRDPIRMRARLWLALAVIPLAFASVQPLWSLHFSAPQYPNGLDLFIYSYTIAGGNGGVDLQEINTLNHYVGMKALSVADFAELDFIPLVMGALALLTLRVAAIGDVRTLLDLAVMTGYFGLFSLGRFAYILYQYGHNLDPRAPLRMDAFMPPLLGSKTLGNFTVSSWPAAGTALMLAFGSIVVGLAIWHALRPRTAERDRTG